MVTLFIKTTCPFSRRVTAVIDRLGIEVEVKDITADATYAAELETISGKQQVPYLIDEAKGVSMPESDDIVAYLQKEYGTPSAPRIHTAGDAVCVACEG